MAENSLCTPVNSESFDREVLDASQSIPVLVDFWADWCQPCKMLAPVLEQLAAELKEKIKITKVNADEEPALTARFIVRSLPTVKLFQHGEVVQEFSGVLPLPKIKSFLEPYLPRVSDNFLDKANAALAAGNNSDALSLLREAYQADPANLKIHPELAGALISECLYDEAEAVIKSLPANIQQNEEFTILLAKLAFGRIAADTTEPGTLEQRLTHDSGNVEARFQLSAHEVLRGAYESAMENLLHIIRTDREYREDGARKALINVFAILNNEGPLVKKYRGMLATLLN